jgi:hypothetical protein
VQNFSKNLGATSKILCDRRVTKPSSIMMAHKYWALPYKKIVATATWCPGLMHSSINSYPFFLAQITFELNHILHQHGMHGPPKKEGCTILSMKTSKKCTNTITFGYVTQKNLRKKKTSARRTQ